MHITYENMWIRCTLSHTVTKKLDSVSTKEQHQNEAQSFKNYQSGNVDRRIKTVENVVRTSDFCFGNTRNAVGDELFGKKSTEHQSEQNRKKTSRRRAKIPLTVKKV